MKIIALTGSDREGRDTVAQYLYGRYSYKQFAFADPIYNMLKASFGVTRAMVEDNGMDEPMPFLNSRTPRSVMDSFGWTYARNTLRDNVWVDALHRRIDDFFNDEWHKQTKPLYGSDDILYSGVVLSDVRLEAEMLYVRNVLASPLLHIQCAEESHDARLNVEEDDTVITNNSGLAVLYGQVDAYIRGIDS